MRRFRQINRPESRLGEDSERKKKVIEWWSHTSLVMITVHFARGVENEALPPPPGLSVSLCEHHTSLLFVVPVMFKADTTEIKRP